MARIGINDVRALDAYQSWIFDCDGVLLDSNAIKESAFRSAVEQYGEPFVTQFLDYHRRNGGASRFQKFDYFFRIILQDEPSNKQLSEALDRFASVAREGLLKCGMDQGFFTLSRKIPADATRLVVSGGAQDELREILETRGLSGHFLGVYGSPADKPTIIERALSAGSIGLPAVFVGDSRLDYETALAFGFDFVFVTHWTHFIEWESFFRGRDVRIVPDLGYLAMNFANDSRERA